MTGLHIEILGIYRRIRNGARRIEFLQHPTNRNQSIELSERFRVIDSQQNPSLMIDSHNNEKCLLIKRHWSDEDEGLADQKVRYPFFFTDNHGLKWQYIGHGSFNIAYRLVNQDGTLGNQVYKINIHDKTHTQSDDPSRAVALWNEINNPKQQQELEAFLYEDGWRAPFVAGRPVPFSRASYICNTLIDIYKQTGRIIPDSYVHQDLEFRNFIKTEDDKVVCIDIGAAVRLAQHLKKSFSSNHFIKYMQDAYDKILSEDDIPPAVKKVNNVVKALMYIELFDLELKDIDLLKEQPELVTMLAAAYDNPMCRLQIDPRFLLTKDEINARNSQTSNGKKLDYQSTRQFRQLHALLGLIENASNHTDRDEEIARTIARRQFCYFETIYHTLSYLINHIKLSFTAAAEEIKSLSRGTMLLLVEMYRLGLRGIHLTAFADDFCFSPLQRKFVADFLEKMPHIFVQQRDTTKKHTVLVELLNTRGLFSDFDEQHYSTFIMLHNKGFNGQMIACVLEEFRDLDALKDHEQSIFLYLMIRTTNLPFLNRIQEIMPNYPELKRELDRCKCLLEIKKKIKNIILQTHDTSNFVLFSGSEVTRSLKLFKEKIEGCRRLEEIEAIIKSNEQGNDAEQDFFYEKVIKHCQRLITPIRSTTTTSFSSRLFSNKPTNHRGIRYLIPRAGMAI